MNHDGKAHASPLRADQMRESGPRLTPDNIRKRLHSLIGKLHLGLLEREEAVRLCVLGAMAGESVFLLGPPGVAKSLIARRIKWLFHPDAKAFEYLMNRFSTPDEIFGPISIAALKADRLERMTSSYLPDATVVFLDEIWKAGPSIQNTLLTAINERIFRNGGVDQKIPLRALISASNELPAEGEGLEALWDRFLIRLEVSNIEQKENRHRLIRESPSMEQLGILEGEWFFDSELGELDRQVEGVQIPDSALAIIDEIISRIKTRNVAQPESNGSRERPEIYVSDRRWKKIAHLLRTSALCNGRRSVDEIDCYLISYCIWDSQDQIAEVKRMVLEVIEKALALTSSIDFEKEWRALKMEAAALPSVKYTPPTLYQPAHYKIDLSTDGNLLTDQEGDAFRRLPKDDYESLTGEFQPIQLEAESPSKTAKVRAKVGGTPAEIVLEKRDDSPPLKTFAATRFTLTHSNPGKQATSSVLDTTDKRVQEFIAEFQLYRRKLTAQSGIFDATTLNTGMPAHLFVELPADTKERLREARKRASHVPGRLLEEIERFAKEKGIS